MLTLTACHFNIKLSKTNPIYEGILCIVCKPAGRLLHNRDQTQNTVRVYITMKKVNAKPKKHLFLTMKKIKKEVE